MKQIIEFSSKVEKFPDQMGWFYVKVPQKLLPKDLPTINQWKFTKIKATVGKTTWDTSLLPMKDGIKFIALKAEVRKKEGIKLGDKVKISFSIQY